jgi:hypothetical protein
VTRAATRVIASTSEGLRLHSPVTQGSSHDQHRTREIPRRLCRSG